MQINGYNIVLKANEKLFAGATSNSFNITPKVKESLTKEDKGTSKAVVTGYDSDVSIEGVMEVNEEGQKTTRADREDIIDMVLSGEEIPFVYGDTVKGSVVRKGNMIITGYSESTNAEGEATYSLQGRVISKLTKETLPAV